MNGWLVGAVLAAFFPFFWEDYYTLQKFVRGLVVVYYLSLALMLIWPHPLGLMAATLSFIAVFSLRYRTRYYALTILVMLGLMVGAAGLTGTMNRALLPYLALGLIALVYIQTFVSVAYDIRKAG
jgi:hypothetical protein